MSVKPEKEDRIPLPPLLENAREAGFEELHRRLAERGFSDIRHAHGCVFRWVEPEGTRLTELADLAGHSKQAVGEFVCDLEARGYVERVPDPADGGEDHPPDRARDRGQGRRRSRSSPRSRAEWAERIGPERVEALRDALEVLYELERSVPVPA